MSAHSLRRWPNIKPALCQCLMFTGLLAHTATRIYWPVIPSVIVTRTTCLAGAYTVSLPAITTLLAHRQFKAIPRVFKACAGFAQALKTLE